MQVPGGENAGSGEEIARIFLARRILSVLKFLIRNVPNSGLGNVPTSVLGNTI